MDCEDHMDWILEADGIEIVSEDGKYTYQEQVEQWVADNDYEVVTEPYRTMYTYNSKDKANTLRTAMEWLQSVYDMTPRIVVTTVEPFTPTPPKQSRGTTN